MLLEWRGNRMTGPPVAPPDIRASPGLRCNALLLLLVLITGLNITSLTQQWLGSFPYHDHVTLGGHGLIPHSHPGDRPAQIFKALDVATFPAAGRSTSQMADAAPVISLRSFVAVEVISGVVGVSATYLSAHSPLLPSLLAEYPVAISSCLGGERPSPSPPPPQAN